MIYERSHWRSDVDIINCLSLMSIKKRRDKINNYNNSWSWRARSRTLEFPEIPKSQNHDFILKSWISKYPEWTRNPKFRKPYLRSPKPCKAKILNAQNSQKPKSQIPNFPKSQIQKFKIPKSKIPQVQIPNAKITKKSKPEKVKILNGPKCRTPKSSEN